MTLPKYSLIGILLICGIASASEFDGSVSDQDAAAIHRIAIVVALGNTFRADFRHGPLGFGDRRFDVPVTQWQIDRLATDQIVSVMNKGGKVQAEALIVDDLGWPKSRNNPDDMAISGEDRSKLLERAALQGEDAILLVTPVYGKATARALPGFGLLGSESSGKRTGCVLAFIAISAYRTSDGRALGQQFSEPCATKTDRFDMKEGWDKYSPDEQAALEAAIKQGIASQIDVLLTKLKIVKTAGTP